jgi:hypothetical protein
MATGIAVGQANAILDAYCRSVAWTEPAAFFVKLHLGDPGAAGTSNPAAETTRQAVTFSAASLGAITNSAAVTWTNVSTGETYSHVSFWDTVGPAGGTFLGSDALNTPRTVVAGDDFQLPIGDVDLSLGAVAS